jgi:hypothetical protein
VFTSESQGSGYYARAVDEQVSNTIGTSTCTLLLKQRVYYSRRSGLLVRLLVSEAASFISPFRSIHCTKTANQTHIEALSDFLSDTIYTHAPAS